MLRLAKYAEMNFKNAFAVRRAHELSPQVQPPMIPTPTHGSFPSGHGTEAFAVARVLFALVSTGGTKPAQDQLRELLMRQAARIAINRTVAGMHYPMDSMAGQALGLAVGEYFIERCQDPAVSASGKVASVDFDGTKVGSNDFSGGEIFDATNDAYLNLPYYKRVASDISVEHSKVLWWLWYRARGEWK